MMMVREPVSYSGTPTPSVSAARNSTTHGSILQPKRRFAMTRRGIPVVCGSLVLLLGLTPCSSNAQTTAVPPPPEGQGIAEQPSMVSPDRPGQSMASDPAAYDRQLSGAVAHVRKAEAAGNAGNIPEMLKHANMSLEQAQGVQRTGTNPDLDDGIADLKQAIVVGKRDQIAPSVLKDARIKLSRAATSPDRGIETKSR